jgi:hypothetical protein
MEKNTANRILIQRPFVALVFIYFSIPLLSQVQNLVQNPGFELYDECPQTITELKTTFSVPFWYSPSKATPDYYNKCNKQEVNVPVNFMGHQWAKEGDAYMGLVLTEHPDDVNNNRTKDYREYIQTKLQQPLTEDQIYEVSFYYCLAHHSQLAVNQLAINLSAKKTKGKFTVLKSENIVAGIDSSYIDTTRGEWKQAIEIYRAKGGEIYLTIGNFVNDYKLKYQKLNLEIHPPYLRENIINSGYAYYYIDGVKVIPVFSKN